jgi:hypothetical protein
MILVNLSFKYTYIIYLLIYKYLLKGIKLNYIVGEGILRPGGGVHLP